MKAAHGGRDKGSDIPAEAADAIFRLFYTTRGCGTGMGLRIVEAVRAGNGVTIRLVRDHGPGAAFEIRVPRDA